MRGIMKATAGKTILNLLAMAVISMTVTLLATLLLAPKHVPSEAEYQESIAELKAMEVQKDQEALAKLGSCGNGALNVAQSGALARCKNHRWHLVRAAS